MKAFQCSIKTEDEKKIVSPSLLDIQSCIQSLNQSNNNYFVFEISRNAFCQISNEKPNEFLVEYHNSSTEYHTTKTSISADVAYLVFEDIFLYNNKWKTLTKWKQHTKKISRKYDIPFFLSLTGCALMLLALHCQSQLSENILISFKVSTKITLFTMLLLIAIWLQVPSAYKDIQNKFVGPLGKFRGYTWLFLAPILSLVILLLHI